MATSDFIMTIDSDADDAPRRKPQKSASFQVQDEDDPHLNPEFRFDFHDDHYADILDQHKILPDLVKQGSRPEPISVDDIIARRRLTSQRNQNVERANNSIREGMFSDVDADVESSSFEDEGEQDRHSTYSENENDSHSDPGSDDNPSDRAGGFSDVGSSSADDSAHETQAEKDRKAAFFDSSHSPSEGQSSFLTMNLSRPILKAITTLGFHKPTPIQSAAIPVALMGKDIVGGAVTGSGKTAAFIVPMLERLLYRERGKKAAATRCLILVPTRELAVQCFETGSKLATHTDVQFCLIVGGLSVKSQEVALRSRPDVLIATPGRLIDHLRNSPSFTLDSLEILVLDEADRMLSDGFADELAEIVKSCPTGRQTMLFSATMTDSVDELVKMSLKRPVRLFVDPKRRTAHGLVQEFVRVRAGKESERAALLIALCKRSFKSGVIVFFRSKKLAHQMRVVFSLLGMKCDELHGDLSQEQRLKALQQFRDGLAEFLMATDLASRGLDIKGIDTVINYDMPGQLAQYLHRVGRTARAGRNGRSVTLVGEADRKMLKAAIKHGTGQDRVRHRIIPHEAVSKWAKRLEDMKEEVAEVLQEETEEKHLRKAEMELKKGENMIEHETEIYARPARTWFQSAKDKQKAAAVSRKQYEDGFSTLQKQKQKHKFVADDKPRKDKMSGLSRKAKRRKLAMEGDNDMAEDGAVKAAIRSAKKAARPRKIGVVEPSSFAKGGGQRSRKKRVVRPKGTFDGDLGRKTKRQKGNG